MNLHKDRQGFTLIEVLIAISISAVVTSAIYQIFLSQQRSYLIQDQVVEMQQNLRTGLYMMAHDIRSAGFDPDQNGLSRFVTDFEPTRDVFATNINYATPNAYDKNILALTTDADESGFIEATRAEMIVYRLNGNELQRFNVQEVDATKQWETVAANIDALNFVLLDQNGAVTTNPTNATAVEVTLLVRTGRVDKTYNNAGPYLNKRGENICPSCSSGEQRKYRRRLLSITVAVRNA